MANWGPGIVDFSPIANLGQTFSTAYDTAQKRAREREQREALSTLGQSLTSDNPNYLGAAQRAFAAGDASTGLTLLKLGEQAKITRQEQEAAQSFGRLFGGGSATTAAPQAHGAAPTASAGEPNEVENRFIGTVRSAGLTNPVGLAAVAAYGRAESGFSPKNANRSWNDPSESGQPGQAGGIMSWRADRLQNLYRFAQGRGEQPGNISPETQAMFLAQEDPQLIPRLNAARSPEEANQIMANAWRFAGFDRPGGENARRLALTKHYASRFGQSGGGQTQVAAPIAPVQSAPLGQPGVQVAENEQDVQRLEAEMAQRQAAQAAPVQMAQAAPQPGAPMADLPAQGAAPAQGFAVPQPDLPPGDPAPQISTPDLIKAMNLPGLKQQYRDQAKMVLENRLKWQNEGGANRLEQGRLQTEKLRRELQGEGAVPLTAEERKAIGIAEGQAAYKTRSGEIKFGPAGTTIKNEGTLPPGYRAIRDANGNLERVEPIQGSEAAQKAAAADQKIERERRMRAETGNTVANALDDIDMLMRNATLPVAGPVGSRLAGMPGTAAHDVSKALETIGANISFQQLSEMRQASPTGGALGAVTERELELLKNSFASLSQSQSDAQFRSNLGRVRATFERIIHGRGLTAQERKAGGPMTMERAQTLRDEAKAAIEGGAPRDAVLKRLKEQYGISTEGL